MDSDKCVGVPYQVPRRYRRNRYKTGGRAGCRVVDLCPGRSAGKSCCPGNSSVCAVDCES